MQSPTTPAPAPIARPDAGAQVRPGRDGAAQFLLYRPRPGRPHRVATRRCELLPVADQLADVPDQLADGDDGALADQAE